MNWMSEEERKDLEKIRAAERRTDWFYIGVLISGLVLVLLVTAVVLG